jgi:hypothetical protein
MDRADIAIRTRQIVLQASQAKPTRLINQIVGVCIPKYSNLRVWVQLSKDLDIEALQSR